jgi:hypothetical protein
MANVAPPAEPPPTTTVPRWVTVAVALIAIVSYLAMVIVLYVQRDQADTSWSRALSLFTGVQAVAFAAFGWALGTQVNQGAVTVASSQAKQAGQRADAAQADAAQAKADMAVQAQRTEQEHTRGQQLAAHLRDQERAAAAAAGAAGPEGAAEGAAPRPGPAGPARPAPETMALARALYPEVWGATPPND